jgi:hypothetical protein
MCLNNAHTGNFISCTVTFESRVKCNVIVVKYRGRGGCLKNGRDSSEFWGGI